MAYRVLVYCDPNELSVPLLKLKSILHLHLGLGGEFAILSKAISLSPEDSSLFFTKASICERYSDLPGALIAIERALTLNQDINFFIFKANLLLKSKNFHEVLAVLDEMLDVFPGDIRATVMKGRVLTTLERYREALSCFQAAVALQPNSELDAWIELLKQKLHEV